MDGPTESWWILSEGNGNTWGCFEDKMTVFPPLMHNFVRIAYYTCIPSTITSSSIQYPSGACLLWYTRLGWYPESQY